MKKQLLYALAISATIMGCATNNKPKSDVDNMTEFVAKLDSIVPNIASPSQMVALFQLADIKQNMTLVNKPINWESYAADSLKCAANIGVYMADAMYIYATNPNPDVYINQDAYLSIAAASALANTIKLDDSFINLVIDRFDESKPIATDSMLYKIDIAYAEAKNNTAGKAEMRFFMAMVMGGNIEKNYLLMHSIFDNPDNLPNELRFGLTKKLMLALKHQLAIGKELMLLAEQLKTNTDSGVLIEKYKGVFETLSSLNYMVDGVKADEIEGFYKDERIISAYKQLTEIREMIIK